MTQRLQLLWAETDGVLAFEWTLLLTLLVIGIVSGVAAARDAIIDELGDTAQVMLAVDQSYTIVFPLASNVHTPNTSSSSDTGFTDAADYVDCARTDFAFGGGDMPAPVVGQNSSGGDLGNGQYVGAPGFSISILDNDS